MKTALSVILLLVWGHAAAQVFPVTGQMAYSAFPVCGEDTFKQATVPKGHTHSLAVPGCTMDGALYQDTNPFWYSFTCYTAGSLGFTITPNNLGDDYDWMLYDITGHDPNDVYTNASLIVTGNWAGTYGLTGAKAEVPNTVRFSSKDKHPTFSTMPNLKQGINIYWCKPLYRIAKWLFIDVWWWLGRYKRSGFAAFGDGNCFM